MKNEDNIKRVRELMERLGVKGEIIIHERVSGRTTEDAEKALGVSRKYILKSLLLKSKHNRYIAVIITGDKRLDFKKLEKISGLKKLRLASPEEVERYTGFRIGGVPPFIFHELCPTYVDKDVMEREYVIGAAGTEYAGIKFKPSELKKLNYIIVDITK